MPSSLAWIVDGRRMVQAGSRAAIPAHLAALLSPSERSRLQGFQRASRACEFLLGRLLMRRALMQASAGRLEEIEVEERPGYAPIVRTAGVLADGVAQPAVSLSHSRGWIACAVGMGTPIGVDIEAPLAGRDLATLAGHAFTPAELSWLALQAKDDAGAREDAFYRLWCAKEAEYKYRHHSGEHQAIAASVPPTLHHERQPHYHLCICSRAEAGQHRSEEIALEALLEWTAGRGSSG